MDQTRRSWVDASRLTVVVGHFGSGKTEFSVNLALELTGRCHQTALADLDIVDPYFRSRECGGLLTEKGIQLISSSQSCVDADVPSMPAGVTRLFDQEDLYGVLDIGGDASGARVLARYRHRLTGCNARVLCVVNANRPLSDTAERAVSYIRSIEAAAKLPIDGLVNNTHLCAETTLEEILAGGKMLEAVSGQTGIPVVCHMVQKDLSQEASKYVSPVFPVSIYLKKPWE